jgi:hypothetical protein
MGVKFKQTVRKLRFCLSDAHGRRPFTAIYGCEDLVRILDQTPLLAGSLREAVMNRGWWCHACLRGREVSPGAYTVCASPEMMSATKASCTRGATRAAELAQSQKRIERLDIPLWSGLILGERFVEGRNAGVDAARRRILFGKGCDLLHLCHPAVRLGIHLRD